eukprot:6383073-Prymnesium_polylepis.1
MSETKSADSRDGNPRKRAPQPASKAMSARNTTPETNQSARAQEVTSATPMLLPRDCGVEVELSLWCKASDDAPCNAPPVSPVGAGY